MSNEITNFLNLLNKKSYSIIINQKIKYFSSFLNFRSNNQTLFNKHKYKPEIIKPFDEDAITQLFMLFLNKFIENRKDKNLENNILFISIIIGKLYLEKIISKNVVLKLSTFLFENQKYEAFFEILSTTGIGELLIELYEKHLKSDEKIIIREILTKKSKYIINILQLDPTKYEPYKFICNVFQFKFNLNLLNIDLLLNDFKYDGINHLSKNYIINIFKSLLSLFEKEDKLQKKDLIRGLYTIDGFKYSKKIQLVEKFNINLNLKIYHKQKDDGTEIYNIFKLYNDKNLIKLYFDEKFNLKLKFFTNDFMILLGKNMDLNHMHSMQIFFTKETGWLNNFSEKIKIKLNGQEFNFESTSYIDGEDCYLSLGEFNGEITEFSIMNNKKEIFKINFLGLYNLYKDKIMKTEFIIDHQNSKLIKINNYKKDKNDKNEPRRPIRHKRKKTSTDLLKELNFTDYFFQNKKTIIQFLDEYGLEYISTILMQLAKDVSNNNDDINKIKDIYESLNIFWVLFQYLYNIIYEKTNIKEKKSPTLSNYNKYYYKKLMTVLYSYSILQNLLSEKMKMPENLFNIIVDFLKVLSNNKDSIASKSFFNHILMIILTQQNTYNNIPIDKISNFLNNLISSKEFNHYLDCYISILIDIFYKQRNLKEIKKMLSMFIENISDSYLIKYIIIFQQFSINKKDKPNNITKEKEIEENNKNYEFSYKLLKLIFKSNICEKTNIIDKPDTEIILYNFQKIFQLTNDNLNKKENLKEDEEKNLSEEEDNSLEYSEENNDNYLSRLKAISIRIIDQFIIKKYHGMAKKSMLVKDEKYNKVKNSISILFSIHNLDLYMIRSLFLTSFDTPNEHGLRFIKHGLDNDGINISELKLIESFTSIKFMFSIFDILKNKNHKNYYFQFIKLFIGETMKKIRLFSNSNETIGNAYKNNYSMNIFEYKKLGILIYNIIIELKKMPENLELNFTADYLSTIIDNILYLHPNPFFFKLIFELINDYIKDENVYEYHYIIKMIKTLIKMLNYENIEKNKKFIENNYLVRNYQLNCIKYISLTYDIIHLYIDDDDTKAKKKSNIIFEDEEQESILDLIFISFITFIKNNLSNPLLYTAITINKESNQMILEIILDILFCYYIYYPSEEKKITQLLKFIMYPKILDNYKIDNITTILCFIDLFKDKDKDFELIHNIFDIEQQLLKTREINTINYFFTLKFLKIIISQICKYYKNKQKQKIIKDSENIDDESYISFLNNLKTNLIKEINIFYLKDITKKYKIKTLDNEYNKFRVKIEHSLLRKENLEKIFDKYISDSNNEPVIESDNDSLSLYSVNNIEQEGDDKSVLSDKSSISIKPTEKFKFKNTETFIEKNNKYDNIYKKMNINNIKYWTKEIGKEGLFSVFKINRVINRGIFSTFINKDDLYDDIFINKIIPEFHNYTHYKINSKINNNILYPTELKNYITSIYTKPFLKRYKNIYTNPDFSTTHKYFVHLQNKNSLKTNKNKIAFVFDEIKEIKCELITNKGAIYCNLYLREDFIIIKNANIKISNPKDLNLFSSNKYVELEKLIIIPYDNIKEIFTRRYLYMYQACEIFTIDNKSFFINFFDRAILIEKFYNDIKKIYANIQNKIIENGREVFEFKNFTEDWNNNKISNFYYLNMLNKYSSLSYNDLQQYPIFPWLFIRYNSELLEYKKYNLLSSLQNNSKLNIINKALYDKYLRLFQFPISAQNEEKRKDIQKIYDKNFLKFKSHYNSHYSTSPIIFYFLVRISPITEEHVKFQGGQFDKIERMFFGPDNFLKIIDFLKDNRELIPDMFYLYEMYYNMNYNYFGYSNNKKMILNNIVLADENMTPIEFVYFNRAKLNSHLISETINLWINNIFGPNQLPIEDSEKMRESCNIFPWQCYEKMFRKYYEQYKTNKDISKRKQSFHTSTKAVNLYHSTFAKYDDELPIDNSNIKETLNSINLFGQCPVEILKKYLTKREKKKTTNKFNLLLTKEISKTEENKNKKDIKNKIINEKTIIYVSYNNNNYIIFINNKKTLYVINKDDFSEKYKLYIMGNFIPLTSSIVIDFNNCDTLIISNVMEEKIIIAEKGKLKYQHKICDIPTCLCKLDTNNIYIGTINGYIQKIKITFQKGKDDFNEIQNIIDEKKVLSHKYQMVREIIYSSSLNIIISLGDDNRIFIRNEEFYELLTVIDLSLYINANILNYNKNQTINCTKNFICGNKILFNNYETLYYINSYTGCIISFTINGLKISKTNIIDIYNNNIKNKKILSSYLINIYNEFRFMYYDINKKKLVEFNPANLEEIFFEYELTLNNFNINDEKNEIKAIFYNSKKKCFDIWVKNENNIEIIKYNLVEQFDKIDIKQNLIFKEDNNIISNTKKLKMEKFSQKKGLFKTTMTLGTSRNIVNKQLFP